MGADYSRVRFNPQHDYSGVGFEQGRLVVDAELNEEHAIADRRRRALMADLSPSPSLPSRLTPGAFKIGVSNGKITIDAGRMYVDGLLAENHGVTPIFDPILAESNGTGALPYDKQPYWPTPKALPTSGKHLVFLDVWERERTHLNTPGLIESAIGVDTSVRTQIAWQVRLIENVGTDVTCGSQIAKWNELIAPSSARLTTGFADVDPVSDPCEIPPGKGYRGPENQLYRVELHSPTQFKWSRDNATVASGATVVTGTELRLDSLGRDDVLRIKDNDWVEITDDRRELNHLPGEIRQVTVNTAKSTITFSGALPADLVPSTYHLRVRKWDSPLITIPMDGSAVTLEHGVTVSFSFTPQGKPRPGDYWVFAARATAPTPDESLEKLVAAPPLGIHHHYVRLALVSMPGTVHSDCRPSWPVAAGGEGCECEVCVTPQSHQDGSMTIQGAIDLLQSRGGGTVRLCPGDYELEDPIKLNGARSIRLIGSGRDSRVVARQTAIMMASSQDVTLSDFTVQGIADGHGILLDEANALIRIERMWLSQKNGTAIGLTGAQHFVTIAGSVLHARDAIAVAGEQGLQTMKLSIVDNAIAAGKRGIDFGLDGKNVVQHNGLTTISGNMFSGCDDVAVLATGLVPQDASDVDGTLEICGNHLEVDGAGITTGGRVRIADNTVIATRRVTTAIGIALVAEPPDSADGVAHILANKVSGFGNAGIRAVAPVQSLMIKQNVVRGCGSGILVQSPGQAGGGVGGHVAVDNNQVLDLRPVPVSSPGTAMPVGLASPVFTSGATSAFRTASGAFAGSAGDSGPLHHSADGGGVSVGSPSARDASGRLRGTADDAGQLRASAGAAASATSAASSGAAGRLRAQVGSDDEDTVFLGPAGARPVADAGLVSDGPVIRPMPSAGRDVSYFSQVTIMFGIAVVGVANVAIAGNTVDGVAAEDQDAEQARQVYGILAITCREARISGNTVVRIGHPSAGLGNSFGIVCAAWQEAAVVTDNVVLAAAVGSPVNRPAWTALALSNGAAQQVGGVRNVDTAAGRWSLAGGYAYLGAPNDGHTQIIGNTLHGGGEDVAVSVQTGGDILMSTNQCAQPGGGEQITVRLSGATATVHGNRVKGGQPSVTIAVPKDTTGKADAAAVVGNITSGGIQVNGTMLQSPWAALNPIA